MKTVSVARCQAAVMKVSAKIIMSCSVPYSSNCACVRAKLRACATSAKQQWSMECLGQVQYANFQAPERDVMRTRNGEKNSVELYS